MEGQSGRQHRQHGDNTMGFLTKLKNKLLGKRENSDDNTKAAAKVTLDDKETKDDEEIMSDSAGNEWEPRKTTLSTIHEYFYNYFDTMRFATYYNSAEKITLDNPRVAFKAVRDGLAILKIPAGATVIAPEKSCTSTDGHCKMRSSEAKVLAIYDVQIPRGIGGEFVDDYIGSTTSVELKEAQHSRSLHDITFRYTTGKTVTPDNFDESMVPCAGGIHFFSTPEEALRWYLMC